jgi:peptidoglycan/LPS O-acetylase OafA/YrhL
VTRSPAHVPALDGVRGVAIGLVMLHHFTMSAQTRSGVLGALWRLCEYGWCGVPLFFVLSGYLITRILIASRESKSYFRTFYVRRTLRIFPLYYLVLLAVLVVAPLVTGQPFPRHTAWLWLYATNLPTTFPSLVGPSGCLANLGHFWSLAVEEQFYLVWPAVVLLSSAKTLRRICLAGIVVAPLSRILLLRASPGIDATGYFTTSQLDALGIGAYLAAASGLASLRRTVIGGAALGAFLGVLALTWRSWHHGEQDYVFKRTAFAFLFGALVYAATRPGRVSGVLSAPWLRRVGKYSYAMYVIHFLPGGFVRSRGAAWFAQYVRSPAMADIVWVVGASLLTFGAGWASWELFERHFAAMKGRLDGRRLWPVDAESPDALSAENPHAPIP